MPLRADAFALLVGLLGLLAMTTNPSAQEQDWAADRAPWRVINDGVMGGVSRSTVTSDGVVRFAGEVRTDFGGGFASTRREVDATQLPVGADAFGLRARGDGNRYRLVVYTRDAQSRAQPFLYIAEFATDAGQETGHRLPLTAFRASFRGRAVPDAPPLSMRDVIGLGLMLTKDGHRDGRGPFALELLELRALPAR